MSLLCLPEVEGIHTTLRKIIFALFSKTVFKDSAILAVVILGICPKVMFLFVQRDRHVCSCVCVHACMCVHACVCVYFLDAIGCHVYNKNERRKTNGEAPTDC